jgi:TolA-binding protein
MTWTDHDHRGQYADDRHDHDGDYAREHHRHYDLENADEKAQRSITALQDEVDGLRGQLTEAFGRIADLEKQTPQARQLQLEADQAAADLAESGYDRWGDW